MSDLPAVVCQRIPLRFHQLITLPVQNFFFRVEHGVVQRFMKQRMGKSEQRGKTIPEHARTAPLNDDAQARRLFQFPQQLQRRLIAQSFKDVRCKFLPFRRGITEQFPCVHIQAACALGYHRHCGFRYFYASVLARERAVRVQVPVFAQRLYILRNKKRVAVGYFSQPAFKSVVYDILRKRRYT